MGRARYVVLIIFHLNEGTRMLFIALHDHMDDYSTPKVFVCVSTVLTWAKSKMLDPVSELV